jgi:hypothetical protein
MAGIERALRRIPIHFEKKWINTTDYTREQIQEAQNKRIAEATEAQNKRKGVEAIELYFLPMRRVMMPLIDLVTNEVQKVVCEKMVSPSGAHCYYMASWWDSHGEPEIKKEVWWDLKKDCVATDQQDYSI